MEPSWTVRTYRQGDEHKIIEVLKAAFGKWGGMEHWNWMFKDNADGFYSDLILLADDKGRFAGHYTIIPARMKIGDEVILGSQSVATATHPDWASSMSYLFCPINRKLISQPYKKRIKGYGLKFQFPFSVRDSKCILIFRIISMNPFLYSFWC